MNVFQLVKRNVVSGFSTYFVYFASVAVNVMMYFIFTSLKYNRQVADFVAGSVKVQAGFKVASVIIVLFALVFIAYSSSYFIRRRKKEIGLYSLMGVTKRRIGLMLFYENLLTGGLALAVGLALGAVFSRLFALLLLRFMGYSSGVAMSLSLRGMGETALVFGGIFVAVSLLSTGIAHRFSLAELFVGGRKAEEEPKPKAWKAVVSVVSLIVCYWVAYNTGPRTILFNVPLCVTLAIIGTYTFFGSFVVSAIKAQRGNKATYYRGLRMFGVSQLVHRLSSNSRTLSTIVILVATALTSMSTGAGVYTYLEDMMVQNEPFTFAYISKDKSLDAKVEAIIRRHPKHDLMGSAEAGYIRLPMMGPKDFGLEPMENVRLPHLRTYMVSESIQNRVDRAKGKGWKGDIRLLRDGVPGIGAGVEPVAVIIPMKGFMKRGIKGNGVTIRMKGTDGREVRLRSAVSRELGYAAVNMLQDSIVIVASDTTYQRFRRIAGPDAIERYRAYELSREKDSEEVSKALVAAMPKGTKHESFFLGLKVMIIEQAMTLFVGFFIGIVFIVSTASIIYFKQLSEAVEDVGKYRTLRQLGVREGAITRSIARQLGFVFAVPLVLSGLHTAFAMKALDQLLQTLSVVPLLYTYGAFLAIYGIFYVLTVKGYQAVVSSKQA